MTGLLLQTANSKSEIFTSKLPDLLILDSI